MGIGCGNGVIGAHPVSMATNGKCEVGIRTTRTAHGWHPN